MANKKTQAHAKGSDGSELDLLHHTTDTPILPAPEYLAKLEEMQPGTIKWFMEETSKEAQSRRQLDNKKVEVFARAQNKGQNFGLIYGGVALGVTCVLAYLQAFAAAGIVGGIGLSSIIAVFIKGRTK